METCRYRVDVIWGRIEVWMVWFGGGCSEGFVGVLSGLVGCRGGLVQLGATWCNRIWIGDGLVMGW